MIEYTVQVSDNKTTWFINGDRHRDDGPAIEYLDGTKAWYLNGERHREDGPACVLSTGAKYWYLNGTELSESEFNNRTVKELSIAELELILGYKVKVIK